MRKCEPFPPKPGEIKTMAKLWNLSEACAQTWFDVQCDQCEHYEDDEHEYVVKKIEFQSPFTIQIMIRRKDLGIIENHWRVFMDAKNKILGDEWEAVEIFPNKSREYDTSNTYHLWCTLQRLPFGYREGLGK